MSERIRILFVTDGLGNGGKERQIIETLRNIDRRIFSPGVLTFNDNQHYTKTASGTADYFEVIRKDNNVFNPFFSIFNTYERFKPDVTHSFDIISALYSYLPSKLYGSKIVNGSIQDTGLDKGWQRKLKILLLKLSDVAISNSRKGLTEYGVNGEVVFNYMNTSRFFPPDRGKEFNVVMVANFTKYKDYDTFIRVMRRLILENLIDEAYAVGSGNNFNHYKDEINSLEPEVKNRIILTGNIYNVEELLTKMSVGFLFSTEEFSEGLSNSVQEYMASGVIPIVSDIGASDELINNGVNGFLVDKYDTEGIAGIVRRLREDKQYRDELSANCLISIKEKFSTEKTLGRMESIYKELAHE